METSHMTTVVIGKGKKKHGMTLNKVCTAKWAGTDGAQSRSSSSFIHSFSQLINLDMRALGDRA